jgi:hypothetical protein
MEIQMLAIPDLDDPSVAFGDIKHLPKRKDLPEEYQNDWHRDSQPFCRAVSMWFYKGCQVNGNSLIINGVTFVPKEGVDFQKALRAIKAVLGSWAPQHEHKIGGAGYMLSQWFDKK